MGYCRYCGKAGVDNAAHTCPECAARMAGQKAEGQPAPMQRPAGQQAPGQNTKGQPALAGGRNRQDRPEGQPAPSQGAAGMKRPPVQGGAGANRPPVQGGAGANRPPVQGGANGNRPPVQGGANGNRPPMQRGTNANRPPMQGGTNANRPSRQSGTNMNRPPEANAGGGRRPVPPLQPPKKSGASGRTIGLIIALLIALVALVGGGILIYNTLSDRSDSGKADSSKANRDKDDMDDEDDEEDAEDEDETVVSASDEEAAEADEEEAEAEEEAEEPEETETPTPTPTPTETPTPTPEPPTTVTLINQIPADIGQYTQLPVTVATASSTITDNSVSNYPIYMFDGRDDTSWQEGVSGYGLGEYITFGFGNTRRVKSMAFRLGNWKNDNYYYGNAKPKTITITAGDFTGQITFTGERKEEWIEFNKEIETDTIRIVIDDVYPGTSWQDTVITEITCYGK